MGSEELRKRFLEFFQKHGHAVVPSSSLVPDDPSVLLTTAGMQQFKPYYTGAADPFVSPHPTLGGKPLGSKNAVSIQKSFRTSDIDEVGDERHLTFFEMMGNFSFGGYFKKAAIAYGYDFLKNVLGLQIDYVTVFDPEKVPEGDWRKHGVPFDEESYGLWKEIGMPESKIRHEGIDNFWGPTGLEGPCGPTTEIYINGIEVWNIVFNQFYCDKDAKLTPLKIQGVDTGMGLERLAMVSQGTENIFQTDLFKPLMELLPHDMEERKKRIFADHARAIVFLIADGVRPSNKEAGYILRRLLRRLLAYHVLYKIKEDLFAMACEVIKKEFSSFYPGVADLNIWGVIKTEQDKYQNTTDVGVRVINSIVYDSFEELGRKLFNTYQESGINFELAIELLRRKGSEINKEQESEIKKYFGESLEKHREVSRAGLERKFGGHGLLLDTGELKAANEEELKIVTRLHTATHLLQAGLRKVLGESVHQAGSDITTERTRFDFTFDRKLRPEELKTVEDWVNDVVQKDVLMGYKEMPYEEAIKTGALYSTKEKYPPMVKIYSAADPNTGEVFSKELCGGPHVTHTGQVGHFKILKEEAVGTGVRRLRATVIDR